jgi:aspartyl/asparaginyl-tRNA synthetase
MSKRSITLVGRASRLQCHSDHVSFLLTVDGKGQRPELVVECQGHRGDIAELLETMDEGSLVGVIGTLRPIEEQDAHSIVRLDRLEILGKPREVA